MKNLILMLALCLAMPLFSQAQEIDSIEQTNHLKDLPALESESTVPLKTFAIKKAIIPVVLISYGAFSVENPHFKAVNASWRDKILKMKMRIQHADDYTQFAPIAIVYGINFAGVKGNNSIGDITVLSLSSFLISTAMVRPLKQLTSVERPDGSNNHSFPSGHTSTAFASAQLMYREYRGKNQLLSLAGYPLAVYTALYRTVNGKHWFGDVMAGAGIGILSAELAYYLLPHMKNIFKKLSKSNVVAYPFYHGNAYGLGIQLKL